MVMTRAEADARLRKLQAVDYQLEPERHIFWSGLIGKYIAIVGAGGDMVDLTLHSQCPCSK